MPLDVVYTKSYNIWSDINPFLESLGQAYVKSQQTKADNELTLSWIADLEKAMKPQEVESLLKVQEQFKETLDVKGFVENFAEPAIGLLQQKEMIMNPEDFQGKYPGITPEETALPEGSDTTQTKPMYDFGEFGNLFKFVSELPTGGLSIEDFQPTLDIFKKQLESGRAMSSAAQQFLSMIIGQSMPTNQRQKVQQDFEFTQDIQSELFPETFDEEAFYKEHPDMELKGATSTGHKTYGKKATKEQAFDWQSFLKEYPDWQIKSINSKGEPTLGRKDNTKKWEFDTWDEAQKWIKAHPQAGFNWKIETQGEGFNVTAIKKTITPTGGTKKLVPTYQTINTVSEDLTNPDLDYDTTMHNAEIKYNLEGVKLPTKADQARRAYDLFEQIIIGEEYIDEKGMVKDEEAYADYYNDYERYAKKYFEETGEILPKKYLSIEEGGKYKTLQWALGKAKGGQKPIFNTENISWSWQKDVDVTQEVYNQIQRANIELIKQGKSPLTLDDFNLEELTKRGVDIDKLRTIFNK